MPGTPDRRPSETIVAFDFGLRRIGVAVGQNLTASASPLATVRNGRTGPDWQAIAGIIDQWRPSRLIVGIPANEDGSETGLARHIRRFVRELARFDLPVDTVDERFSSLEAGELLKSERAAGLRGKIGKEAIDSAAAALIAGRWLRRDG